MERIVNLCSHVYEWFISLARKRKEHSEPLIGEDQKQEKEMEQISPKKHSSLKEFEQKRDIPITMVESMIKSEKSTKQKRPATPQRNRSSESDSFVTIKSATNSSPSIMKRTFRSKTKQRKNSFVSSILKNDLTEFKSMKNFDTDLPELQMLSNDSKIDRYAEFFIEWNKKQYLHSEKKFTQPIMSQVELMKLSNQSLLDQAVNQLEDYYIFYLNEKQSKISSSGKYENGSLKCSFRLQDENIFTSSYMKLICFTCNTENPVHFLQWYNSLETQAILNRFFNVCLLENGQFPVLQVEQFGEDIVGKNIYTIVRQIELVSFDYEPEKQYILQLDTTMGKTKKFKSFLRFDVGQAGNVQIYSECTEDIKVNYDKYFGELWGRLQQKLIKDKIVEFYSSKHFQK